MRVCFCFTNKIKSYLGNLVFILLIPIFFLTLLYLCWGFWIQGKIEPIVTAISILLSTLFAVLNWREIRNREIKNTQRNIRLTYLENSYKQLALGVRRAPQNPDNKECIRDLEEAIATIQLYGEKKLIQTLLDALKKNPIPFDNVLQELRNSLRKELKLKKIEEPIIPLRTNEEGEKIAEYLSSVK